MGTAVEIRDIKIINQCLEVQRGVVACFFPFSVWLFLCLHLLLYFSLFFPSIAHFVFCTFSGGSVGSEPRSKSGFKCSHTRGYTAGTIPPSHLALKVEDIVCVCICVWRVCVSVGAISHQFIARLFCCNLLMDHLWGVICIMQKLGVLTPLKTDSFNSPHASPLLPLSCLCCCAEGGKRGRTKTRFLSYRWS